ncbi:serine protease inhibitor 3-like [Pogonomyrmex barbatus]|uniref:Serine protease inhibitor 3-like n=1 Tax=Pogonomyrmex barbatus TaxID=144034 RepID=A0A6I9XBZ1_9HYME|nr:serine protease inhibitor 3-like [Pogonomyrmex barbatus]
MSYKFTLLILMTIIASALLIQKTLACEKDERKFDGCNTCICIEGSWACTKKWCGP